MFVWARGLHELMSETRKLSSVRVFKGMLGLGMMMVTQFLITSVVHQQPENSRKNNNINSNTICDVHHYV
jgi:hypothetical protein